MVPNVDVQARLWGTTELMLKKGGFTYVLTVVVEVKK
jgi:hypothetical protein